MIFKQRRIYSYLVVGLLLSNSGLWAWELRKNENGIKVFTRGVAGSKIKEYRVEAVFSGRQADVEAVLADTSGAKQWIDRLKVSKVLKVISPGQTVTYTVSDAPWPVKDRETISQSKTVYLPNGDFYYTTTARPDFLPPDERYVRVKKLKASWLVQNLGNGKVRVVHQAHADPGGSLPGWLANLFVVDIPFNTLKNLRDQVNRQNLAKGK